MSHWLKTGLKLAVQISPTQLSTIQDNWSYSSATQISSWATRMGRHFLGCLVLYCVAISHLIWNIFCTGEQQDDIEDKIKEESKFTGHYQRAPPVNCTEKIVRSSFKIYCWSFDVRWFLLGRKIPESCILLWWTGKKIFENKRILGSSGRSS